MKLKSLLLGSAAALFAVTGSQAADAVVVEAEPVEYVRVCDMYGAGYFFIPGTETCLRIGGRVRLEYEYQDSDPGAEGFEMRADMQLRANAINETDYGTLGSFVELQGGALTTSQTGGANENDDVFVNKAYLTLGSTTLGGDGFGLRAGYDDSFWARNNHYGFPTVFSGPYGFTNGVYLEATYQMAGFSVTGGIEGNQRGGALSDDEPRVYAGASYGNSFGYLAGHVLYDTDSEEVAYGVSAEINAIENLTIQGWYHVASDPGTVVVAGDEQWGIGASYGFGDWSVAGGYGQSDGAGAADLDHFATIQLGWSVAPGLSAQLAYLYTETDGGVETDRVRLRVTRSW